MEPGDFPGLRLHSDYPVALLYISQINDEKDTLLYYKVLTLIHLTFNRKNNTIFCFTVSCVDTHGNESWSIIL